MQSSMASLRGVSGCERALPLQRSIELQEGLGYGVEAFAMEWGGAETGEGFNVLGTVIAFVAGQAVAGELAVETL